MMFMVYLGPCKDDRRPRWQPGCGTYEFTDLQCCFSHRHHLYAARTAALVNHRSQGSEAEESPLLGAEQ